MRVKRLIWFPLFALTIFLFSCNTDVEPVENTTTVDQYLYEAIKSMALTYQGFDMAMTQSLWLRQSKGVSGTAQERYIYNITPENTEDLWQTFYLGQLKLLDTVEKHADAYGNGGYYKAVAEILEAQVWATLTDMFGDVPYVNVFSGIDDPVYDSQQIVYEGVFYLLDDAISIIESGNKGTLSLGDGDVLFNWDMDKWLKYAYTLKARYLIRLSKVESTDYSAVIADLDKGIESLSDEPRFYFSNYGIVPPIADYISKNNTIQLDVFFYDILDKDKDPRFQSVQYNGFWAQGDTYFPFVQYTEALLLRAEANIELGNMDEARQNIKDAVLESLKKYQIPDYDSWYSAYSARLDTLATDSLILEVAKQKYIDLVYNPEGYSEWRRLNYPQITPVVDGDTIIPLRYPYSKTELDVNDNAPDWYGDYSIFDPVWWDK